MPRKVRFNNNGTRHIGTYRVEGRFLVVTCAYGTRRAILGFLNERRLAQTLLRTLVRQASRNIVTEVPEAAVIEAVHEARPSVGTADLLVPALPIV